MVWGSSYQKPQKAKYALTLIDFPFHIKSKIILNIKLPLSKRKGKNVKLERFNSIIPPN